VFGRSFDKYNHWRAFNHGGNLRKRHKNVFGISCMIPDLEEELKAEAYIWNRLSIF
jgi:hypothetical protein